MTATGIYELVIVAIVNTVPDGEKQIVVLFGGKCIVECKEDLVRFAEIRVGQCMRAQHIDDRNRQQGCSPTMTADIDQIDGEVILIDPVISK